MMVLKRKRVVLAVVIFGMGTVGGGLVQGFGLLGGARKTNGKNSFQKQRRYHGGQSSSILFDPLQQAEGLLSRTTGRTDTIGGLRSMETANGDFGGTDDSITTTADVLVLGSGPTARAVASLLSSDEFTKSAGGGATGIDVVLADKNYDRQWVPNYGVWQDEWEAVSDMFPKGLKVVECINRKWSKTDCFFGGSFDIPMDQRMRIDRPYWRVDRFKLRQYLSPREPGEENDGVDRPTYRIVRANHVVDRCLAPNVYSPGSSVVHDASGSTVRLSDGTVVRTKIVIDCTGHESKLTQKDPRATDRPGFQIAYGAMVTVDESMASDPERYFGPYDKEAMTLFDYRTDHFDDGSREMESAHSAPTFNYVMPIEGNQVFFEETSLVARPGVSFVECKNRLLKRLDYLGIKVVDVEEEEFCYIPMGGALPAKDQRIIGLGGACATVHPSTGYHICRMMSSAKDAAGALAKELGRGDDFNADRAAASAYDAVWNTENIRQRNFAVFGGEFLMKQNVEGLRGFFDGFFRLPLGMWAGFLAGWPGLPNNETHETWLARMWFGLNFIIRIPTPVALDMAWNILTYSLSEPGFPLPQSVTPFLGEPESYKYVEKPKEVGDVAAKAEAREMITASKVDDRVPVQLEQ